MNKLYNTQGEIANTIRSFLKENTSSLHKPQLNFLPEVIFGMITSDSSVASDIAKSLKEDFTLVQYESTIKRIHRLFNNSRYEGKNLFTDKSTVILSLGLVESHCIKGWRCCPRVRSIVVALIAVRIDIPHIVRVARVRGTVF